MALSGAGVGLIIPTLTGAGTSSLAPGRFATGAAVLTMGRQVGSALGIAVLVAVLGTGASTAAGFHSAWLICTVGGVTAGLTLAALGRPARSVAQRAEVAEVGTEVLAGADAEVAVLAGARVGAEATGVRS